MGFSLKRALAGAVVGAGNAVTELADLQLKEEAANRLRAQELADKRQLMGEESELISRRQQSELEMKKRMLDDERKGIGAQAKEFAAGYKGKDITSPEGQRFMAGKWAETGRIDLANIYEDNARTGIAARESAENRRAQIAMSGQNHRDNMAAVAESRNARLDAKMAADRDRKDQILFKDISAMSDRYGEVDRATGKFIKDENALQVGQQMANFMIDQGRTYADARDTANDAMRQFHEARKTNPSITPQAVLDKFQSHIFDRMNGEGAAAFNASGKKFANPGAQLPDFTNSGPANLPSTGLLNKAVGPTQW